MLYDLILADGSIVKVSMAGVGQQGDLWIHAHGLSVLECASVFGNPEKTAAMHIQYDETIADDFVGFTVIISISVCDDFVKVGMSRA